MLSRCKAPENAADAAIVDIDWFNTRGLATRFRSEILNRLI
ncbi:hypothetical protein ABIA96_001756 [Bradyrhizobium sp. LB11.1]